MKVAILFDVYIDYVLRMLRHSLSQQGVWVSFGHPNPLKVPLRIPTFFCEEFLKMSISSI